MRKSRYLPIILMSAWLTVPAYSQGFLIPLRVADSSGHIGTISFGIHPNPSDCNFECPPKPPTGVFDIRFGDVGASAMQCLGPSCKTDLRPFISAAQIDTYNVQFQAGEGGYPFTFSWPDLNQYYGGGVWLQDPRGGLLVNVDMITETSYTLSNMNVNSLLIIAAGPRLVSGIGPSGSIPDYFILYQNYPNPFNPSTTIKYEIPTQSHIRLQIFNLFGSQVAELANNVQGPGYHEVRWIANVPSGIYFYRLEATPSNDPSARFAHVRKLVLMK